MCEGRNSPDAGQAEAVVAQLNAVCPVGRITASLTQEVTLHTDDSIEDLREFLVVTAYYTDIDKATSRVL